MKVPLALTAALLLAGCGAGNAPGTVAPDDAEGKA